MNTELILTIQNYITALRKEETRISNARLALEKAVDALQALEESTTSAVLPEKKEQPESKAQSSPVSAYTCTQCGTPRSIGSASLCRSCYHTQAKQKTDATNIETPLPKPTRQESQEDTNPLASNYIAEIITMKAQGYTWNQIQSAFVKRGLDFTLGALQSAYQKHASRESHNEPEKPAIARALPQPLQPTSPVHPKKIHFKKKAPPTKEDFLRASVLIAEASLRQPCFLCKEFIKSGDAYRFVNNEVVLHRASFQKRSAGEHRVSDAPAEKPVLRHYCRERVMCVPGWPCVLSFL